MTRVVRLAPLLLAITCVACATRVGVEFDPVEDFSEYRTWDWLPRAEPRSPRLFLSERSPLQRDPELEELIVSAIESELESRGFPRADGQPPDFFVTYHVKVQRELVVRMEQPADQRLDSHHQSRSYVISAPVRVVRPYERGVLVIDVAEGRDRQLVWRAELETRVRGSFTPHVSGAVADLVERFPPEPEEAD